MQDARHQEGAEIIGGAAIACVDLLVIADAAERRTRREREAIRRAEQDRDLSAHMAESIRGLFPGCSAEEAQAIAAHASVRGSGRVGRTSAGRALEPEALTAAVVAAVRHKHTHYDRLLMRGYDRMEARKAIRDEVNRILERWRQP